MQKMVAGAACLALVSFGPVTAFAQGTKQAVSKAAVSNAGKPDLSTMHVQVILDRLGFSPGVIDGLPGKSLVAALKGFQESRGLSVTGEIDKATLRALYPSRAIRPTVAITLTNEMLAGPYTNPLPKDPAQQAKLLGLGYRTAMEKLAEMFHTTPATLMALNSPSTPVASGTKVIFPNVVAESRSYDGKLPEAWRKTLSDLNVNAVQPQGAKVVVDKSDEVLRVLDKDDKLIAQFSATMGSSHDPLPIGKWTIKGASYNPPFHYNPDLFWDAKDNAKAAKLPPGPNGPVGVIWLDLSKPHYGIHGTPEPSTIGRAESHGCIRLTNWDAARLSMMIKPGTPAVFQN